MSLAYRRDILCYRISEEPVNQTTDSSTDNATIGFFILAVSSRFERLHD
jgi:hypothetical protein